MRPPANESDDDEALEVDRPPPRELTEWEQADRAAAARETREREEAAAAAAEAAAAELRIVGGLALGSVVRVVTGADAMGRGGLALGETAEIGWFRIPQSELLSQHLKPTASAASSVRGTRIVGASGDSHLLTSEDVGCFVRAVWLGAPTTALTAEATSLAAVAPPRPMLQLVQTKLDVEERHAFRVEQRSAAPSVRTLTLVLTRKRVELVEEPAHGEAEAEASASAGEKSSGWASRRRSAKASAASNGSSKPAVVQSEVWGLGVTIGFVPTSEAEFTLQLASGNKPRRRPPPLHLSVSTRQQRDLLLLAFGAFARPEWLANAQSGGTPYDLAFLTPAEGAAEDADADDTQRPASRNSNASSGSDRGAAAASAQPKKASSVMRAALSFGMGRKKR